MPERPTTSALSEDPPTGQPLPQLPHRGSVLGMEGQEAGPGGARGPFCLGREKTGRRCVWGRGGGGSEEEGQARSEPGEEGKVKTPFFGA